MINRGWVVTGALMLVAAPVVPAAAAGMAMVLERVDVPPGIGKWVRTGDVLRFRVRFEGAAGDVRVAVAASPVRALSAVTCPSDQDLVRPFDAARMLARSRPIQSAPATSGVLPTGEAGRVSTPAAVPGGSGVVPTPASASGVRPVPGGSGAMPTLASASGARPVPAGSGAMPTPASGSGAKPTAAGSGVPAPPASAGAGVLAPPASGASGVLPTGESGMAPTPAPVPGVSGAPVGTGLIVRNERRSVEDRALAAVRAPVRRAAMNAAQVCHLGDAAAEQAVDVLLTVPEGTDEVVLASAARMPGASGEGATTLSGTATTSVDGAAPLAGRWTEPPPASFAVSGHATRVPSRSGEGGRAAGTSARSGVASHAGTPGVGSRAGVSGRGAERTEMWGESGAAEVRTGSSGTGVAMPAQQAGTSLTPSGGQALVMPQAQPQPGDAAPQSFVAALENNGSADLGAPLPRQIAVSTRRAQRLEPANPLAGAHGAPAVAGGIAVLLGGLWVVARKQRARIRKMEQ